MTSQDLACGFLKTQLLEANLTPGRRVIARDLAVKLGISRTPVREALGRLEQEQLVTRDEAGGYTVRAFTAREIGDLYRVREVLEVEAATEAMAAHIDDQRIAELRNALEAAEKEINRGQSRKFILASRKFHALIASYSGNSVLQDLLARINDKVQLIGAVTFRQNASAINEVMAENRAILEAITANDTAEAIQALKRHIRNGKERILRIVVGGSYE